MAKLKKKKALILLIIVGFLIATAWVAIRYYPERMVHNFIPGMLQAAGNNADAWYEEDAIVVVTVGTSSSLPGERSQTGTAIFVNGYFFMFDVGAGIVQKAENFGLPLTRLNGVFLTHYHSDHIMGLPNIISRSWQLGRKNDLSVYGPEGLDTIVRASNAFLNIDNTYREAHHGPEIMDVSKAKGLPMEYHIEQNAKTVVFQKDGITITAFDVDHEPINPAVGYAIEYKGKKVVISGDTKKCALLEEIAQDCDLLIHEVLLMSFQTILEKELDNLGMERNAKIVHDIQDYHTSPVEVAALAQRANVKKLILNHLGPAPDNILIENMYLNELKGYKGPLHLANDGDTFVIK